MGCAPNLTRNDRAYRREKLVTAYQRGACYRSLAKSYNVSLSLIRRTLIAAGVPRRNGSQW